VAWIRWRHHHLILNSGGILHFTPRSAAGGGGVMVRDERVRPNPRRWGWPTAFRAAMPSTAYGITAIRTHLRGWRRALGFAPGSSSAFARPAQYDDAGLAGGISRIAADSAMDLMEFLPAESGGGPLFAGPRPRQVDAFALTLSYPVLTGVVGGAAGSAGPGYFTGFANVQSWTERMKTLVPHQKILASINLSAFLACP